MASSFLARVCQGMRANDFFERLNDFTRVKCKFCEEYSDCNKVNYAVSHTKSAPLDKAAWCSELLKP